VIRFCLLTTLETVDIDAAKTPPQADLNTTVRGACPLVSEIRPAERSPVDGKAIVASHQTDAKTSSSLFVC